MLSRHPNHKPGQNFRKLTENSKKALTFLERNGILKMADVTAPFTPRFGRLLRIAGGRKVTMWNAKGMSKVVLAIALVLVLLVQVGVSVAQCKISSKSISASAYYRRNADDTFSPYASVRCSCTSDSSGHSMAVTVEMQHNGRRISVGSGTNSARYSTTMSSGTGTITAIGRAMCVVCRKAMDPLTAQDSNWEAEE